MISCIIDKLKITFINFEFKDINWILKCSSPYETYENSIEIEKITQKIVIPVGSKIERKTKFFLYHVPDDTKVICSFDGKTILKIGKHKNQFYSENNSLLYLKSFIIHKITLERYKIGWIRLHGSAILDLSDQKASVFLGNSGTGKSSTAFNLISKGSYSFISDDVVFVKKTGSFIKICGIKMPIALTESEVKLNKVKFEQGVKDQEKILELNLLKSHTSTEIELKNIFYLNIFKNEETYVRKITDKKEAVDLMIPNFITNDVIEYFDKNIYFQLYKYANRMAEQCNVFEVQLGKNRSFVYNRIVEVL